MPERRWTPAECERLKRLLAIGIPTRLMRISDRTGTAIGAKARRLHLTGDGISRKHWRRTHERILYCLRRQGWSVRRITASGRLPYNRNAIAKKCIRLGLVDPAISASCRNADRFTAHELELFQTFLCSRAENHPPEEIALLWNAREELKVTHRRVCYHLEQLGRKLPRAAVMQMPYSKAKRKVRSERYLASQERRWKRHRSRLLARLRKKARTLLRNGSRVRLRSCRDCKIEWPQQPPFFRSFQKRRASGTYTTLSHRCRLCWNKRIRERNNTERLAPTPEGTI